MSLKIPFTVNVARSCTCGATWRVQGTKGAELFADALERLHAGEGHAPCSAVKAKRVRDKKEKVKQSTTAS